MVQEFTTEILNAALEHLTAKRHEIDQQIAEVRRKLGSRRNGSSATADSPSPKRHISAAGRRAIAAAQRRRWAEQKAVAGTPAAKAKKPKRKLSPTGRAAIVAAVKKRWAAKGADATKMDKVARTKAA